MMAKRMNRGLNPADADQALEALMDELNAQGKRPRLLLHICCGPCTSAVLERLRRGFEICLLFDNPNLDREEEFDLRLNEARRLSRLMGEASFASLPYEPELFQAISKGFESEKEGGARCARCFELRLRRSALYAKREGFDCFTTTLSVSPHKNAALLNGLGEKIGMEIGIPYLKADFKKQDGALRSIELSRLYGLYRQDYCGCVFSKEASSSRAETENKIQG